jgi:hypothetical protein
MDTPSPKPVTVPILVGVTGKRKSRLDELGVSEDGVRRKLRLAFALVQELAPHSPKILLCGMADGVDEIAARLVIDAPDEFRGWSVVGLLPMPEEAFLEDFDPDARWWYDALDEQQQKSIRRMPLAVLAKAATDPTPYTVAELCRLEGRSNPARTAHYEQLAMVLAERSTVLIAVMPEDETPDRLGGTAQVVAHRLNGWRPGWPPAWSRHIAETSSEVVVPAPLATPVANDVWLIPIGAGQGKAGPVDLRILRQRQEFDLPWPQSMSSPRPRRRIPFLPWRPASRDVLIHRGRSRRRAAWYCCPLLRSIDAFNRRAANIPPRPPPPWDDTINAFPDEPARWSPLAAMERLRGTLSEIQRDRKKWVGRTVTRLALIAGASIALLELYAELLAEYPEKGCWKVLQAVLQAVPFLYVALVVGAVVLYWVAARRSWPAVAEDYRLVAEALRVQIVWWRMGLTARRDRVDNFILRYDTRGFQLLRRGLATVLDAIRFSHDEIPTEPGDRLPEPVMQWIDNADRRNRGQIQYHAETVEDRRRRYGLNEFVAWSLFGISLGAAVWLAAYTGANLFHVVEDARNWIAHISSKWLVPVPAFALGAGLLWVLGKEDIRSPDLALKAPHILGSWIAGMLLGAAVVALWAMFGWGLDGLRKLLFLGSVILLAWAGIIRYRTEKIAIEAEAEGSEMAYPIYRRAKAALDEIESQCGDAEAARRCREWVIRDLGEFALAETEAWLRSHRERPLHPAL